MAILLGVVGAYAAVPLGHPQPFCKSVDQYLLTSPQAFVDVDLHQLLVHHQHNQSVLTQQIGDCNDPMHKRFAIVVE